MKNTSRLIMMTAALLIAAALWLPGLRSRRVAAQSPGLMGSYGFTAISTGGTPDVAVLGVLTFDGAGNVTGSQTIVSPDPAPNATTVTTQPLSFTGTYTVNPDGTGIITIQVGSETVSAISFVIIDGGSGAMFVQTGGSNTVITGTARKQ